MFEERRAECEQHDLIILGFDEPLTSTHFHDADQASSAAEIENLIEIDRDRPVRIS